MVLSPTTVSSGANGALQKALEVNLDDTCYGTIAEIGAGQEVARCFFRAGGAAGTVAKTLSAYDMKMSDSIYGGGSRYVSRDRLQKMLDTEYQKLVDRLESHRPTSTRFFAFADTVAAKSYRTQGECHGWMGCALQIAPQLPPSQIVIHVRMLDESAEAQHDALGILGVNLIHGAFKHWRDPRQLVKSLKDNLFDDRVRINIDLVAMQGPRWDTLDSRIINMYLLDLGLTPAIMFNSKGQAALTSEEVYKKSALVLRGHFRPLTHLTADFLPVGLKAFLDSYKGMREEEVVSIAEISTASILSCGKTKYFEKLDKVMRPDSFKHQIDIEDFLGRVDTVATLGCHVMVTHFGEFYRLRQYIGTFTKREIGIVVSCRNIPDIFNEEFYQAMEGRLLEAFGRLFAGKTSLYVYPMKRRVDGALLDLDGLELPETQQHLMQHLKANDCLIPLKPSDPTLLDIEKAAVLKGIENGDATWKEKVPEGVYELIKSRRLFGYDSAKSKS